MEIEAHLVEIENPFAASLEPIRGIGTGAVGGQNPEEDPQ